MAIENELARFTTFSPSALESIRVKTAIEQVEFRSELASTNDLALELAGRDDMLFPLLVLADRQTAGRGRKTNRWWSDQGALTFSLVLDAGQVDLPPNRWPQASLTVGLAVCEALEALLHNAKLQIKWPNDVYLNQKKICGILVESPQIQHGKLIIGVGINVNNSLEQAPPEIADLAIALCDAARQQFPLSDVLIAVLNQLHERLGWIGQRDQQLWASWKQRCFLTGKQIRIDTPSGNLTGICQGIDDEGALLLQTDTGLERCLAGTITLLEGLA